MNSGFSLLQELVGEVVAGRLPLDRAAERAAAAVAAGQVDAADANRADDQARDALERNEAPVAFAWAAVATEAARATRHPLVLAYALESLGRASQDLFMLDLAAASLQDAITLFAALEERERDVARCQYTLAQVRRAEGNLAEAARLLLAARARNGTGPAALDWELDWMLPAALARVAAQSPHTLRKAFRYYDQAIASIEQVRQRLVDRSDRFVLGMQTTHIYLEAAILALRHGRTRAAYGYLLGSKAREGALALGQAGLTDLLERLPEHQGEQLKRLLDEEQRLERALRGPDTPAPGLDGVGGSRAAPPLPDSAVREGDGQDRQALRAVRLTKQRLLEDLARRFPDETRLLAGRSASPAEVQTALDPGELLLDLLVHNQQAWLFLVSQEGIRTLELDGPRVEAELDLIGPYLWPIARVQAQLALGEPRRPPPPAEIVHRWQLDWREHAVNGLRPALRELGRLLFDDPAVRRRLKRATQVLVSPPNSRALLPWAAVMYALPADAYGETAPSRLGTTKVPFGWCRRPVCCRCCARPAGATGRSGPGSRPPTRCRRPGSR